MNFSWGKKWCLLTNYPLQREDDYDVRFPKSSEEKMVPKHTWWWGLLHLLVAKIRNLNLFEGSKSINYSCVIIPCKQMAKIMLLGASILLNTMSSVSKKSDLSEWDQTGSTSSILNADWCLIIEKFQKLTIMEIWVK